LNGIRSLCSANLLSCYSLLLALCAVRHVSSYLMARPFRHRQTKGTETDKSNLRRLLPVLYSTLLSPHRSHQMLRSFSHLFALRYIDELNERNESTFHRGEKIFSYLAASRFTCNAFSFLLHWGRYASI